MLSDRDRRYLHEIEQRLEAEDPHLASALGAVVRPERWLRRAVDATIALSIVLAAVCLILPGAATMGPGLLAGVLAVVVFVVRRRCFPTRAASGGAGALWTARRGRRSPSP